MHNNGRGDVLSSRAPTAPGMVLQCLGWWHNGGDGRTGAKVTGDALHWSDVTAPSPRGRWIEVHTPFEGSTVLSQGVRRGVHTGVGGTMSRS
jgi:hypothetical protein